MSDQHYTTTDTYRQLVGMIRNETVEQLLDRLYPDIPEKISYVQFARALGISKQALSQYIKRWKAKKQEAQHAA